MRVATFFAIALALTGCANGPSLMVVDVSADAPLDNVATLSVLASVGTRSSTFSITPASSIGFESGQSFGIDLPKDMSGTLKVHVDAVDGSGNILASGDGSAPIKSSGRANLAVTLSVLGGADLGGSDGSTDLGQPGDLALPPTGPVLTSDRTTQMFGSVTVGKMSNSVMIKVTNSGQTATDALMFATSGANVDQFSITNGCTSTLAPNASCYVTTLFAPTAMGDKAAHFDVSSTTGGTVGVDLSGTGTPPGTLTIAANAPANGNCGSALVGQTSATSATYLVTNVGTSTTGAMTVSTGDPQFLANGCTGTLDPNMSCTITVYIKPSHNGTISSSVQVSATPGGVAPANVSGTGLNPAAFSITSTSGFNFGSTQRDSGGSVFTFTATNTGDVMSNALTASTFTGTNGPSFLVTTDNCQGQMVAAGSSCTVLAEFKPLLSGTIGATLHINDSTGSLGMANVTGVGTPYWAQETLPLPTGQTTIADLTTVFGVAGDGTHVYAAGGNQYFVRDATGTWSGYTMSPLGLTPAVQRGWAIGTNSVFLADANGILRSTVPTSWSYSYELVGGFGGVVAFSGTDAWATGSGVYRLSASTWAQDTTFPGGGTALWAKSDNDIWVGGGASINNESTATAWHRDGTGTWTQIASPDACHTCVGNTPPSMVSLWGFGTPTTTLYAAVKPVEPMVWTSASNVWTPLGNTPTGIGGPGNTCGQIWGSSPNAVWYPCSNGVYLYTGNDTWDGNALLTQRVMQAVWGSSAIDVYAVGPAGAVWHYY